MTEQRSPGWRRGPGDSPAGAAAPLLGAAATVAAAAATVEILVSTGAVAAYVLPPPSAVVATAVTDAAALAPHVLATAWTAAVALALATVTGVLAGTASALRPWGQRWVRPAMVGAQSVPVIAVAPLLTLWLGFGPATRILLAALIAVFPVLLGTSAGVRATDRHALLLARALGLRPWTTLRTIRLPGALPGIFGGLRVASSLVLVGVVVGELLGSSAGLGHLTLRSAGRLEIETMFAAFGLLAVLGWLLYATVATVERAVTAVPLGRRSRSGAGRRA